MISTVYLLYISSQIIDNKQEGITCTCFEGFSQSCKELRGPKNRIPK